jgi:preprotein translocase subunit SecG
LCFFSFAFLEAMFYKNNEIFKIGGNMTTILLTIHIMIAVSLVGVVLLQRSEGGALGIGGGGGGFMTARGTANLLTRITALLAAAFFVTSISLAILAGNGRQAPSIIDEVIESAPVIPDTPVVPTEQ